MTTRNSTPCRFGFTAKGKLNRKHRCKASCQWTAADCIDWLNRTPYPTQAAPPIQVAHAPCECGAVWSAHFGVRTDNAGRIKGIRFQPCAYRQNDWPATHLPTCDCLDCVTSRITSDLRERIAV